MRMGELERFRASYDWRSVFDFACGGKSDGGTSGNAAGCFPCDCDTRTRSDEFKITDVADVIDASDGENDGAHFMCVVLLNDGRFAFLDAWCDYTGWDCQSGGEVLTSTSLRTIERAALTDEARERLPGVQSALVSGRYS